MVFKPHFAAQTLIVVEIFAHIFRSVVKEGIKPHRHLQWMMFPRE